MRRSRRTARRWWRVGAALTSLIAPVVVASPALATATLRSHPHEGTAGTVPSASTEHYTSRTGTAVSYTAIPPAAVGTTSMAFSGAAATYFDDNQLTTATGSLVWSAPVLLPALPPAGKPDGFLLARNGSTALSSVEIAPSGRLRIKSGGTVAATSAATLATGTWYRAEFLASDGQATVRLFDLAGTLLDTVGPASVTAGAPNGLRTGLRTVSGPLLIDAVQVADDWITPDLPPPSPCGSLSGSYDPSAPPAYRHVVVLMEENLSYSTFRSSTTTPYLTQLSRQCGSETNFHAATHPSQPNYMAATSGVPSGVGVKVDTDNVFEQVQSAGGTWRTYAESMPGPCATTKSDVYKPGHNPAVFYSDLRTPTDTCTADDLPMDPALSADLQNDSLPGYSWITPNECHDFYWVTGCSTPQSALTTQGDAWLAAFIPRLTALPSYQAGETLIVVTFDEGFGPNDVNGVDCTDPAYYPAHPDCQIPTIVVSPYIVPGATDASDQNLYSLLGTTEDILGVGRLNRAVGQPSMRPGLGF